MSTVLLVGLTAGLAILSLWSPEDMHDLLARPAVRFGLVGLSVVLSAYSVEKEVSLRRVSRRRAAGAACRTDRCGATGRARRARAVVAQRCVRHVRAEQLR